MPMFARLTSEASWSSWLKLATQSESVITCQPRMIASRAVPQDDAKAMRWYTKAAKQGHATAQAILGIRYYEGRGVPQDYAEAVRWYRMAAEQGNALAQFELGFKYSIGRGVPKNNVEAAKWFRAAAERDYLTIEEIEREAAAYEAAKKAAEQGDANRTDGVDPSHLSFDARQHPGAPRHGLRSNFRVVHPVFAGKVDHLI